ncbi:NAD(P)/FAD-dependent oxidoreductase, partial [Actinokineospora sp.]|uniref:NAD(P)/FAD-dependent oxidoreductase n=1 Tax=Actinokineospora sp. TaxID=1872133 RepID=UPI003D6AF6AB
MVHSLASSDLPASPWTVAAEPFPDTRPLEGDRRADVVVVGAGYTGLSAALHLAERGAEVVVLDAAEPGWGASGRNGGQIIPGLKHDPDELERRFGEETGRRMWQTAGSAADFVFELIARHKISCHAERCGWIAAAPHAAALESLRSRTEQWQRRGAPV